jgi:glycosyltransferase involved in cell wall biosynthesis
MLVLLTHNFPFGDGECFLENEIPFLLEKFPSITIISLFSKGKKRPLPKGVRHISLPHEGKIKKLYRSLIEPHTYKECIKHPEALRSPNTMKYLLGYTSYCHKLVDQLKTLLQQEPQLQQALFYTYWFHVQASALAVLKNKHFPQLTVISRAHGYDIYEEEYTPAFIPMRQYTASAIDHIYSVSEDGKNTLCKKLQLDSQKVTVERLGTETPGFITKNTSEGHLSIASCSYLVPEKQIERIIFSIAHLATMHPTLNITWNHFGGGPLHNQLHDLASKQLSNKVVWHIHGKINNQAIYEYYQNLPVDVFLSTSKTEGIPVSMMEAASCGIPIIAPDVGGIREIVSDDNGKLLPKNTSPEEIAKALSCPTIKLKRIASQKKWEIHFSMDVNYRSFAHKLSLYMDTQQDLNKS